LAFPLMYCWLIGDDGAVGALMAGHLVCWLDLLLVSLSKHLASD
jgi:hypothetical protein